MEQRTRMFKTLGCLAGAMTGTAVFLGWIDPSLPLQPDILSSEQLMLYARSLVAGDVEIDTGRWRSVEVEITPDTGSTESGPLLSASPNRGDWHFQIDGEGRPSRSSRWRLQQPCPERPSAVHIRVAGAGETRNVTQAQWLSVEGLLAALNESAAPEGTSLPFHLRGD